MFRICWKDPTQCSSRQIEWRLANWAGVQWKILKLTFTYSIDVFSKIWGILKHRVKREEPRTKPELRAAIVTVWREMDSDKAMLRKMMESIPARLMAVIDRGGRQVAHKHYKPQEVAYKPQEA